MPWRHVLDVAGDLPTSAAQQVRKRSTDGVLADAGLHPHLARLEARLRHVGGHVAPGQPNAVDGNARAKVIDAAEDQIDLAAVQRACPARTQNFYEARQET